MNSLEKQIRLGHLLEKCANVEEFLQKVVEKLAFFFHAQVCSIYLYNKEKKVLTLMANVGLNKKFIRQLHIPLGSGIAGKSLKNMQPIINCQGSKRKDFFYIKDLGEENYNTYLAIPITRYQEKIGVLLLQRQEKTKFSDDDQKKIQSFLEKIVDLLEEAQTLISFHKIKKVKKVNEKKSFSLSFKEENTYNSNVLYSEGQVLWLDEIKSIEETIMLFFEKEKKIEKNAFDLEMFEKALTKTVKQIDQMQKGLYLKLNEVARDIFTGHILILKDKAYTGQIRQKIKKGMSVITAIYQTTKFYEKLFSQSELISVQEKILDLWDISQRLLFNLYGNETKTPQRLNKKIVIVKELMPSQLLYLAHRKVSAIILGKNIGFTSHIALIAKSLSLPLLTIPIKKLAQVSKEARLFLDFKKNELQINPPRDWVASQIDFLEKTKKIEKKTKIEKEIIKTKDGHKVEILANVNLQEDLDLSLKNKMAIGLYRSEFLFLMRNHFPSEEDQYLFYRDVFQKMKNYEVVMRTLDIGGDKMFHSNFLTNRPQTTNIFGLRSIRFLLKNKEIFYAQMRAIFRAAYGHKELKILLPFISSLDELLETKRFIAKCHKKLYKKNKEIALSYKLGVMIEIPALALMIKEVSAEVDFFSIGTNDLAQFLLASSRDELYEQTPFSLYQPALLRLVDSIIEQTTKYKKEITLCGTMAENLNFVAFLLGSGLRRFSIQPKNFSKLEKKISQISIKNAKIVTKKVLKMSTKKEIQQYLKNWEKIDEI